MTRSRILIYGNAVISVVAATAARLALDHVFGYRHPYHPYVTFYLAVLWAAWYGGFGPGLLATLLGGIAALLALLWPLHAPGVMPEEAKLLGLEFYAIVAITAVLLTEAQRRARLRSEAHARLAQRRLDELEIETRERAKAELAARQAEQELRATYEHAPVGICSIALDGRYLQVNPRFCEITGYTSEELTQRRIADITHPEDAAAEAENYRRLREGQIPFYSAEQRFMRKDGAVIWADRTVTLVRDAAGNPRQTIAVTQDITERKRTEERLQQSQKLETIGVLAGGIAHDFNNLLTGILGSASLALETVPEPVRPLLETVVVASERAAHLTRQLLAYSGKGQFLMMPVDVSATARETLELVQGSLPPRVHVRSELPEGLPAVLADPGQMQQLIANLLLNAGEALAGPDGIISVRTGVRRLQELPAPPNPVVGELAAGEYVFLSVEDTGTGINPGVLANIFDPFFTTKFTGRGLGLAAVSGIVRAHRGAVLVSSAPNKGSTFTILFPPAERGPGVEPGAGDGGAVM